MPELQTILQNKDNLILGAQQRLTDFLFEQGNTFANDLARVIGRGNFTQADIIEELTRLGYDEAVTDAMANYEQIFRLSEEASDAIGINFLVTAQNEGDLLEFLQTKQRFIQNGIKQRIADNLVNFGSGAKIGQRPVAQIKAEAQQLLEGQFRRVGTEVETALTAFDRAVDQAVFENVGIDKFVYFPPTLLDTSRPACISAITNSRQQTGWTRQDIDNHPDLDFVMGGKPYYNCRHRFIPFVAGEKLTKRYTANIESPPAFTIGRTGKRTLSGKTPTVDLNFKPNAKTLINKEFPSGAKGGWVHGAGRRESVLMKMAAKEELGARGALATKRNYNIFPEEISNYRDGVRDLYQETQDFLRSKGIKKVKLYRGVRKVRAENPILSSWTDDINTAKKFDHGSADFIIEQEIAVDKILAYYKGPNWVNGKYGQQFEYIVINK